MYKWIFFFTVIFFISCNSGNKRITRSDDKYIVLSNDTMNFATLKDTLLIHESTCRGCEYEGSTHFDIYDSLGMVKLVRVETTDDNPSSVDGGSIHKELFLAPQKTGETMIKLYKFWAEKETAKDSAHFTSFNITIKN